MVVIFLQALYTGVHTVGAKIVSLPLQTFQVMQIAWFCPNMSAVSSSVTK